MYFKPLRAVAADPFSRKVFWEVRIGCVGGLGGFWGDEIGGTACLGELLVQVVGFREVLAGKRKRKRTCEKNTGSERGP